MKFRNPLAFVATVASLIIVGTAVAQQSGQDQSGRGSASDQQRQSATPDQSSQSGSSNQNAAARQQADEQITRTLAQIAQDPKTAADKLFLLTAALHNQSEIELAREVMQKTQNPQVKKMAQNMIQELQKTRDQLQQTAQAVGLQLPPELGQAAVQEVRIVAALPADQLDRQYTAQAQADNAQDASQYQSEAQIAQDPQVKRFAQQQAEGIQQRSQDANQTAKGIGMPGGEEAQPASGKLPGRNGESR